MSTGTSAWRAVPAASTTLCSWSISRIGVAAVSSVGSTFGRSYRVTGDAIVSFRRNAAYSVSAVSTDRRRLIVRSARPTAFCALELLTKWPGMWVVGGLLTGA
jgi:hypothetical protein